MITRSHAGCDPRPQHRAYCAPQGSRALTGGDRQRQVGWRRRWPGTDGRSAADATGPARIASSKGGLRSEAWRRCSRFGSPPHRLFPASRHTSCRCATATAWRRRSPVPSPHARSATAAMSCLPLPASRRQHCLPSRPPKSASYKAYAVAAPFPPTLKLTARRPRRPPTRNPPPPPSSARAFRSVAWASVLLLQNLGVWAICRNRKRLRRRQSL